MEDFAADLSRFRSFVSREGSSEGDRLPTEPELAALLGVTRNRIRRLLKAAEGEGLIWRHVGKGTFIGNRSLPDLPTGLADRISPLEAFEARLAIEPKLASLAAARALPADIEEMRRCVATMRETREQDQWIKLDHRLHRLMAQAARNTLLLALYDMVREAMPPKLKFRIQTLSTGADDIDAEHDAWVEAIADHDPRQAEELMRLHIESIRQRVFGAI
ncbi:FadR/GntR family transcriptional regulator [Sphingomonas sp.]|uniref:FadR/GntR family transcriptional regulator n=1 Tax=Sphingomonas sp. TaxID=28214 RepID=UPI000DB7B82B|nr:FCD domain-containing protein [Sphingomonas sp.]PZU10982.1 MAG: FadR family transcriptional regulator [Sphingomonas sp.]